MADLTLSEIIRRFVEEKAGGLHVSCPGRVVSYDAATQRCSVRALSHVRIDDTEIPLPVIDDVPVAWPRSSGCLLSFPLTVGDPVLLVFTDRMLDLWRGTGESVAPSSPRTHNLTDAVALPWGVWPDAQPDSRVSATDVVLAGPGSSKVSISPDGSVTIESGGSTFVGGSAGAQALALAPLVEAQNTALKAALQVLAIDMTALGSAVGVGASTALALGTLLAAWPTTVAAVKAKGV